jgi:hypothetical protein
MLILNAKADKVRKATFNGAAHIVVPVVAIVEGVLQASNSAGPELYLAEEFGKAVESWNGRPVVIDHPEKNGKKVSANSPEMFESEAIGFIFNTRVDGNKLKMEAWINTEKAEDKDGVIAAVVKKLENNEVTEVSTGLFAAAEPKEGTFNGKKYVAVLRNIVPDHLAILSSAKGACSLEDGCGAPRTNVCEDGCKCEKCLRAASTTETAKDETKGAMGRILEKFGNIFRQNKKLSDIDTRTAIQTALQAKEGGYTYVMAVFDNSFVYEAQGGLFQRDYSMEDGVVNLSEKAVRVRPETRFVPVKTNEENTMADPKKVDALIANEGTKFEDKDKEWLLTLSDEQLSRLEPAEPKVNNKKEEIKTEQEKPTAPVATPVTAEKYLEGAPAEIQEVLSDGLRLRTERRNSMIKALGESTKCAFSKEELEKMPLVTLEKMSKLAEISDYSGRGGPRSLASGEDPDAPPAPPDVFEMKKAS